MNGSGRVTSMAVNPSLGWQTVQHAFAEPLRELCCDAVAEDLLNHAVAGGHALVMAEMFVPSRIQLAAR